MSVSFPPQPKGWTANAPVYKQQTLAKLPTAPLHAAIVAHLAGAKLELCTALPVHRTNSITSPGSNSTSSCPFTSRRGLI